jgi:leader peptidase (prepilin peptidase) / N-methyltransferase
MLSPDAVWPLLALALGLIIGSFANVCIHRIPLRLSVVHPRSRCPRCQTPIGAADNIPVLSYLFLGGRCRVCRARISIRYPLVEALNGALYFLIARGHPPGAPAGVMMALVTGLLVLSLIDLDHQILPDVITFPGIALGLAASLLEGPPSPRESVLAAVGGYVIFMLIARTWERMRGMEALGQGDWKLAAMLGAFFGWQKLLLTVFMASLAGTLVGLVLIAIGGRNFQHRLPLGTFLGAAGILVLFLGDPVVGWYGNILTP